LSSKIYERIDKEEAIRIAEAAKTFFKEKKISLPEIVGNEIIQQELNRGPSARTSLSLHPPSKPKPLCGMLHKILLENTSIRRKQKLHPLKHPL
jgi:hypothetical protein